ncbi:hypothetical protein KFK09_005107 [Dendrobium nobile]|uniref:Uncharacterized protein n=1 Tax=Dendrobium nobile TaxID=94219 RepID=A0A8T3BXC0_DENNO|nr:hypothetical protein KFK09_005107 [Dendrobium nobile]
MSFFVRRILKNAPTSPAHSSRSLLGWLSSDWIFWSLLDTRSVNSADRCGHEYANNCGWLDV